jgi:amino acid adenylation domain-containing protein
MNRLNERNISFEMLILSPLLKNIKRFSDRNAFYIHEVFYTYEEFGNCISKIRAALKKCDPDETYVGLVANDDIETYASVFALWLEGKSFIPLHPNRPIATLEGVVAEMDIHLILDSSVKSIFPDQLILKTSLIPGNHGKISDFHFFDGDRITYVLFTSGSTGQPKGVTISRKNIAAFIDSFEACGIQITEKDKCLQCFDLTFDVSVQSFLVPLLKGACVYTIPHDQIKYGYVAGLLEDHKLTFAVVAPSMLRFLKPYFEEIRLPSLNYCILTAEASPLDLIEEWSVCIPNAKIFNFYGPTEATIYCTYYKIKRNGVNKALNGMVSIGKPLKNVNAIIVDENNHIVPKGEKGELCVSGNHISSGYWQRPEKNKKAFFTMQYYGKTHRFYRTGDICYSDHENDLMLLGRSDSQIKIQGYRVEPGEIEFHARAYLQGYNAIVETFTNQNKNTELALFVEKKEVNKIDLLNYMKTKMPHYMIPTRIIVEEKFPLNANFKVDKIKLKKKLGIINY